MVAIQIGPKAGTGVRVLTLGNQKTTIPSSQQEGGDAIYKNQNRVMTRILS